MGAPSPTRKKENMDSPPNPNPSTKPLEESKEPEGSPALTTTASPPSPLPKTKTPPKRRKNAKVGAVLGKDVGSLQGRVKGDRDGKPIPSVAKRALDLLGRPGAEITEILAVMSADPSPTQKVLRFMDEAQKEEHSRHSLARIAVMTKIPIAEIFQSYARGVKSLGTAQTIERVSSVIAARAEEAVTSLMDQAVPQEVGCTECGGTDKSCMVCDGKGKISILPKFWPFAQKRIYELAGIVEKGGGITLNSNTTVAPKIGVQVNAGEMLGKLIAASDAVVNFTAPINAEIIEPSKIVQPEDNPKAD